MNEERVIRFDTGERLAPGRPWRGETPIHYELPLEDGWLLACTFMRRDDELILAELKIVPLTDTATDDPRSMGTWSRLSGDVPNGGITSSLLRSIPIGEITKGVLGIVRDRRFKFRDWLIPDQWLDLPEVSGIERPGRAGRDDRYYVVWAARYAEKAGSPRPIAELAEEHGLRREQVRDLIHTARERDLLTPGRRGRPQGELTAKSRALLEQMSKDRSRRRKR